MQAQEERRDFLDTSDDDSELALGGQESYREEVEEIVKGFIIEKEILSEGHEEEINRIKENFQREKSGLLRQLENERRQSRMASIGSETGYGSGSHDSEIGNLNLYGAGGSSSSAALTSTSRRDVSGSSQQYSARSSNDIDNSLVREIAEVYMRMSNCPVASQVRPDLDIEDKFEREREVLERKFLVEKREMKRKLEDEYNRKLEQEKSRYEGSIHELKNTVTDLQWQKRELESKIRTEKEKCEINYEREKNDLEKRQMAALHDFKKHIDEKHSAHLERQRVKYEENISDLQGDIMKLTSQLRELNENLSQEKEIIMSKFEKEIKEMEQTFAEQRSTMTFSLESEFSLKLQNETSVLKTLNKRLQDDFDSLEREKKDLERKWKDDKRKMEEHYEEEIAEMERKYSEERRNIKTKFEGRYQNDKQAMEMTISELREEILLLRNENSQMDAVHAEKNAEFRQQIEIEREEFKRKIQIEREETRIRFESEYVQKFMSESSSHTELIQQLDQELGIMKSRCVELEGATVSLRQERDMMAREKDDIHRRLQGKEFELQQTLNQNDPNEVDKLKELLRQKDNDIRTTNLQKEQIELSMSAFKREKFDLEDEVARLKRKLPESTTRSEERFVRSGVDNSEVASLQENSRRKDEELHDLKRNRTDLDSRVSSLQRKNDELEDELAALRRKKLEVEDEISAIKRDKSDSDNQISYLRRDKADIEEQMTLLKRKQGELEDAVSANKRGKMEMEHEIALLKRNIDTLEKELSAQVQKAQQSQVHTAHVQGYDREDGSRSRTPTQPQRYSQEKQHEDRRSFEPLHESRNDIRQLEAQNVYGAVPDNFDYADNAINDIERSIDRLANEKDELEDVVRELQHEKKRLEREIDQAEARNRNNRESQHVRQANEDELQALERQKEELNQKIEYLKDEFANAENRISKLRRDENGLSTHADELNNQINEMESRLQGLIIEERRAEKVIQTLQKEKAELQENMKRDQVQNNKRGITSSNGIRKHDCKDHELAELRKERDGLKREVATLKKQLGRNHQPQVEETLNNVNYTKEMRQFEDREVVEMKKERMQLERVVATLRRQKTEIEAETTVVEKVKKHEEDDLTALRRERVELEIQVTNLQSQKTRLEAEVSMMKDERKRDDNEVDHLRREKNEVEKQLYSLQSKRSKVEADISITEDTWRIRSATSRLSSDVEDLEKELQGLRNQRVELQTEITRMQSVRNREEHELTLLRKHKSDLETQIEESLKTIQESRYSNTKLGSQYFDKTDSVVSSGLGGRDPKGPSPIFSDVTVRQENENRTQQSPAWGIAQDHPPTIRTSIEITHLSQESPRGDFTNGNEEGNRRTREDASKRGNSPLSFRDGDNSPYGRSSPANFSFPRHQVSFTSRDNLDSESPQTTSQSPGYRRDNLDSGLPRTRSQSPAYKRPEQMYQSDSSYLNESSNDRFGVSSSSNGRATTDEVSTRSTNCDSCGSMFANSVPRERKDGKENGYRRPEQMHQSNSTYLNESSNDRFRVSSSSNGRATTDEVSTRSTNYDSYGLMSANSTSRERGRTDGKEDNDVVFLQREKQELEIQISEMRIQLAKLHSEVTEIESRKVLLETIHRRDDGGRQTFGEQDFHDELKTEVAQVKLEDKRDSLTQEYENQLRELRECNMELKQKVGLLEWQLENAVQKLEIQEMSFRRELSTAKGEGYLLSGVDAGMHNDDTGKLRAFYKQMNYLLIQDISNDELMKEIRQKMKELEQQKINIDVKNVHVHNSELDNILSTSENNDNGIQPMVNGMASDDAHTTRTYTSHLRKQLETAEVQLKTCEKIIHRLYAENSDLNKIVLKLEGKLKTSNRSQEKLQRKRVLLQKLVERLSGHVGKEQLQQSYLVLELDKDIAI